MKSAEDWCTQYEEALAEEHIKDIQLDAMKEGARRAADECRIVGLQYGDYDQSRDGRIPCNAASDAILTTAEQWTEKDL